MMKIKNAQVFTEDYKFEKRDVYIENGIFSDTCSENSKVIDAKDCYIIPGLIDIHLHGCMGHDFCDKTLEAIEAIATYQASKGITTIVPTTLSLPEKELLEIMQVTAQYKEQEQTYKGACIAGINMEGPFINVEKRGAQQEEHIRKCDIKMFRNLQKEAHGMIKLVDIAPEEEGAMDFIKELHQEVTISLAHTGADYDIAKEALAKGANHVTHLYNGMPSFSHRDPGVVGAAFDTPQCKVELICDGIHIHPTVVRATFEMFGSERIIMISDSMSGTGMSDGEYTLGGEVVSVRGNQATLKSNGRLAGSATNLMNCIEIAVNQMGVPLESAVRASTINPAKVVGIDKKLGSITVGKIGNAVILNKDLSVKMVIQNGAVVNPFKN